MVINRLTKNEQKISGNIIKQIHLIKYKTDRCFKIVTITLLSTSILNYENTLLRFIYLFLTLL